MAAGKMRRASNINSARRRRAAAAPPACAPRPGPRGASSHGAGGSRRPVAGFTQQPSTSVSSRRGARPPPAAKAYAAAAPSARRTAPGPKSRSKDVTGAAVPAFATRARPARRRRVAEGGGFVGFVVERSLRFVADDLPGIGDGPEARRVAAPVGVVLLGEAEVGLLRLGSCCCWTYAERRVGVRAEAPPRHSSPEAVDEGACAQHRRDGGCGAAAAVP